MHLDTLAGLQAEYEAAFHLTFLLVEWLGREEATELSPRERDFLRLLTPIVKLTTGRQSVVVLSEIVESFGGAGYVEDTGIPVLLRDAQVFSIWEGTTNVLALDALRTLHAGTALDQLTIEVETALSSVRDTQLLSAANTARIAMSRALEWLKQAAGPELEAGARRFALTLGRSL